MDFTKTIAKPNEIIENNKKFKTSLNVIEHESMDNDPMEIIRGMRVGRREITILEEITNFYDEHQHDNTMHKIKLKVPLLMAPTNPVFL